MSMSVDLVEKFRVDGIPHIAFLTNQASVQTALVGAVPEEVLQQQINALAKVTKSNSSNNFISNHIYQGDQLPFQGFDAFEGRERTLSRECKVPST